MHNKFFSNPSTVRIESRRSWKGSLGRLIRYLSRIGDWLPLVRWWRFNTHTQWARKDSTLSFSKGIYWIRFISETQFRIDADGASQCIQIFGELNQRIRWRWCRIELGLCIIDPVGLSSHFVNGIWTRCRECPFIIPDSLEGLFCVRGESEGFIELFYCVALLNTILRIEHSCYSRPVAQKWRTIIILFPSNGHRSRVLGHSPPVVNFARFAISIQPPEKIEYLGDW